jgi:hypothetical protein
LTSLSALYDDLARALPKSLAVQRILLDFCDEESFKTKADTFIRTYLRKCVPCLFALVKALYKTRSALAASVFEAIVEKRLAELASEADTKEERAYALFFKAQHLDKLDPGSDVSDCCARRNKDEKVMIFICRPVPKLRCGYALIVQTDSILEA